MVNGVGLWAVEPEGGSLGYFEGDRGEVVGDITGDWEEGSLESFRNRCAWVRKRALVHRVILGHEDELNSSTIGHGNRRGVKSQSAIHANDDLLLSSNESGGQSEESTSEKRVEKRMSKTK